ncbi:MAG TPA: hypothetical protein P5081_23270 [Phycisphaerae bacterium]|nr:hypothetical protein [Phycisphaerae bacterium]HRW55803.1 hypothetical protein [Phycisphaerae bacterium]
MLNTITGVALLTVVALVYGVNWLRRRRDKRHPMPAGHPWSGLALTLIGGSFLWAGNAERPTWHAVVALVGALCWLVDMFILRRRRQKSHAS